MENIDKGKVKALKRKRDPTAAAAATPPPTTTTTTTTTMAESDNAAANSVPRETEEEAASREAKRAKEEKEEEELLARQAADEKREAAMDRGDMVGPWVNDVVDVTEYTGFHLPIRAILNVDRSCWMDSVLVAILRIVNWQAMFADARIARRIAEVEMSLQRTADHSAAAVVVDDGGVRSVTGSLCAVFEAMTAVMETPKAAKKNLSDKRDKLRDVLARSRTWYAWMADRETTHDANDFANALLNAVHDELNAVPGGSKWGAGIRLSRTAYGGTATAAGVDDVVSPFAAAANEWRRRHALRNDSPIQQVFGGIYADTAVCPAGHAVTDADTATACGNHYSAWSVTVGVPEDDGKFAWTVQGCLQETFAPVTASPLRKMRCEHSECSGNGPVNVHHRRCFVTLPPVLVVHVDRAVATLDFHAARTNSFVCVDDELDVNELVPTWAAASVGSTKYKLASVVHHMQPKGAPRHFWTEAAASEGGDGWLWHKFAEDALSKATVPKKGTQSPCKRKHGKAVGKSSYMLFYKRCAADGPVAHTTPDTVAAAGGAGGAAAGGAGAGAGAAGC